MWQSLLMQQQEFKYIFMRKTGIGTSCSTRLVFIGISFSLLLIAAIILVFSASGIIIVPNSVSNALVAIFTTSSAIFGFGQWVIPLSTTSSKSKSQQRSISQLTRVKTAPLINVLPTRGRITLPHENEIYQKLEEDRHIRYGNYGALIVYAIGELNGQAVHLYLKQPHK